MIHFLKESVFLVFAIVIQVIVVVAVVRLISEIASKSRFLNFSRKIEGIFRKH